MKRDEITITGSEREGNQILDWAESYVNCHSDSDKEFDIRRHLINKWRRKFVSFHQHSAAMAGIGNVPEGKR